MLGHILNFLIKNFPNSPLPILVHEAECSPVRYLMIENYSGYNRTCVLKEDKNNLEEQNS